MVTPDAGQDAVAHAREKFGLSESRACSLIGVARRVVRSEPTRPNDAGLRQRLRDLAGERRRFGYWRLGYAILALPDRAKLPVVGIGSAVKLVPVKSASLFKIMVVC